MVIGAVAKETKEFKKMDRVEHPNVAKTLRHLNGDKMLLSFSKIYLQHFSTRYLDKQDPKILAAFLSERFHFFNETLTQGNDFEGRFHFSFKQYGNEHRQVLEFVCPDASHILITIQALFKEFDLRILRTFHPIMAVGFNSKDMLEAVDFPGLDDQLVTVTYIEFDPIEDEQVMTEFNDRISYHLFASVYASYGQKQMFGIMEDIKSQIETESFELSEPKEEWLNLLDWLRAQNFSTFGYLSFRIDDAKTSKIKCLTETGLGILESNVSSNYEDLVELLDANLCSRNNFSSPFVFDIIPFDSPIQRFEHLMRLSLKVPQKNGQVIEHVFVGLLRRSSLMAKNIETPLIHLKMAYIFNAKSMLPGSYNYNEVIRIFMVTPKYELFRSSKEMLLSITEDVLNISNFNDIYSFYYPKDRHRRMMLMLVIPGYLFTKSSIKLIQRYLKQNMPQAEFEMIEIYSEPYSRLHVYFPNELDSSWVPNCSQIELDIKELIRPWEDRVWELLLEKFPPNQTRDLYSRYLNVFPEHYRSRRTSDQTLQDIVYLEMMREKGDIQFNFMPFTNKESNLSGKVSLLTIYSAEKIDLISMMPILQNMGFYVYDELTARVGTKQNLIAYIHSFRVADISQKKINEPMLGALIIDLLGHIFSKRTENDRLNGLVLQAGLDWRQINLLQTYRNLYIQLGARYGKEKIDTVLLSYPNMAQHLVAYFEAKFDPSLKLSVQKRQETVINKQTKEYLESLSSVKEIADDIIFKRLFNLMDATLRTNYFIPKESDSFISIKLNSSKSTQMPLPVPYREIYVHDVGFEGTHLRFGPVSRGGLRWSSRPYDFRTEILGLVKTQQTKNVVIVPVGSKGGFVIKPDFLSQETIDQDSRRQYRKFISGLLDITDTVGKNGKPVHPKQVVCYDDHDAYLVVAADKGTAMFSDEANTVSQDYGFWLDDAFASGGSSGYNHKDEGITARGAWECVRLHFLEMGKDVDKDLFTVVGVGDMSGDVFGNGMLRSSCTCLQAAFNHIHIFLDPNPNPELAFKERERLFNLPQSTWKDFKSSVISKGGGVYDRGAKEIELSEDVKKMLGIRKSVVTGEELIGYILKMKVDLVWFGGIGTYIKSDQEDHRQVGDPGNDSVRVNASEFKGRVIGEGANLGLTQTARIALAEKGVRLNTDAIDNSAGVNMSDYEVNMKILLQQLLEKGQIKSLQSRDKIMRKAVDEVSDLVLANNQAQHRLISMALLNSKAYFSLFHSLIKYLSESKGLDLVEEDIPEVAILNKWKGQGKSIVRPVLSVLQAYVKMYVVESLQNAPFITHHFFDPVYRAYFPSSFQKQFKQEILDHHLKTEILSTQLTNKIINQAGMTFFYECESYTGASVSDIAKAYLIMESVIGSDDFRQLVLNEGSNIELKYDVFIDYETQLKLLVIDVLNSGMEGIDFDQIPELQSLFKAFLENIVSNPKLSKDVSVKSEYSGFSEDLLVYLGGVTAIGVFSEYLEVSRQYKLDMGLVCSVMQALDQLYGFGWLRKSILSIEDLSSWGSLHKFQLLQQLKQSKLSLVGRLAKKLHVSSKTGSTKPTSKKQASSLIYDYDDIKEQIVALSETLLADYKETLQSLKSSGEVTPIGLSVVLDKLRV